MKRRRKSWGKCLLASKLAKSALELNNRTRQLDDDDDDDDVAGNGDDYDDSTEPSLASTSVCFYCFRTSPCPSPNTHRARLPLGSRSVVDAGGGYSTLHKRHFLRIFPVFVRFYSLCRFVLLGSFAVVWSKKES